LSIKKKYYTAADIEKYHSGLLSAKEMHELEKAALDDPFLADALEGYGATPVNISADISDLEQRLRKKTKNDKGATSLRNSSAWWKIAAAIVVLAGAGFVAYELSRGNDHSKMSKLQEKKSDAQQEPATKNSTVKDSGTKPMSPLNQETVSLTVPAGAGKKPGKK